VISDLLQLPLKLAVFDHDRGALDRDDPLGTAILSLDPLLSSFLHVATVPITHKGVQRGVLHIHASWTTPAIDRDMLQLSRAETSLALGAGLMAKSEMDPKLLEQVNSTE
jgi:hypothetical protein